MGVDATNTARRDFDVALWAYVIMPEHVHLMCSPRRPKYRREHILAALKRCPTPENVIQVL